MAQEDPPQNDNGRIGFVKQGRKLAIGTVLLSSAVAAHAEPDVNKIPGVGKPSAAESRQQQERLKSVIMDAVKSGKAIPETEPRTDCVGDPNKRPVVNLFIGGFGDATTAAIGRLSGEKPATVANYHYNLIASKEEPHNPGIKEDLPCNQTNLYTTHDNPRVHKDYLENWARDAIVNIIGHSYGGHAAIELAGELNRKVDLLITVDPVIREIEPSRLNRPPVIGEPKSPPPTDWQKKAIANMGAARKNVTTWVNILAEPPEDTRNSSDVVADMGGQYGTLPKKVEGVIFIPTRENHANFWRMIGCNPIEDKDGKTAEELVIGKKVTGCGGRER